MDFKAIRIIVFLGIYLLGFTSKANTDSLIRMYEKSKKDTSLANIIMLDIRDLRGLGHLKDAEFLLHKYKKMIFRLGSKKHIGKWYMHSGINNDFAGNYDSAYVNLKKALKIFEDLQENYLVTTTNLNLGVAYMYNGETKNALKYFLKALELAEKYKVTSVAKTARMNLGGVYFSQGDYKKALGYFKKRIQIEYEEKDEIEQHPIMSSYYNIALIHFKKGEIDTCEYYLNKSFELAKTLNDKSYIADAHAIFGAIRRTQGRYDEAVFEYNEALRLMYEMDVMIPYDIYLNISLLHSFLKNRKLALAYSDTALFLAKKGKSQTKRASFLFSRAQVHNQLGEYKLAYDNLYSYCLTNDSLFSDENEKDLANMKLEYDKKKQADSIKLVEKTRREKQKAVLEAKAEEQDRRAKTILFSVLAVSVLVIVFAFFMYRRFQITKRQNRIIEMQKMEVILQKEIVEEKNKEIVDSINYARRLQDAILPSEKEWNKCLPDSFILYLPKDIVAGDFYWLESVEKSKVLFAACDCTGHGVPGALVSVVCSTALNRSVKEFGLIEPGKILDQTTDLVIETFKKSGSDVKDGMDISLCALNLDNMELRWAGANNSLWILRNNEILEWKADKQPVGVHFEKRDFKTHTITLVKNDIIYVFSDGFADQFGGDKKKKFRESSMKKMFLEMSNISMDDQKKKLYATFEEWKGDLDQIDDVCIIGVKV